MGTTPRGLRQDSARATPGRVHPDRKAARISPLGAVGLALAAYTCFVLADTGIKWVGAAKLPAYEVVACLGLAQIVILLAFAVCRGRSGGLWAKLWPRQPLHQGLRACLDLANNLCVVVALRHVPLALFYILVFLAPIVTTLLAALFLGERLEWKQGVAIGTGFAGVVIAVNPLGSSRSGDSIGFLACMVCVTCFSLSVVWSRRMTQTETPESLIFFSALVQTLVPAVALLWHAAAIPRPMIAVLGAAGGIGVVGSLCFFLALKHASAATVSQVHYSQLLTGALLAYLIWRERPAPCVWAGAALIVGAGIYSAAHARRRTHSPAGSALTLIRE